MGADLSFKWQRALRLSMPSYSQLSFQTAMVPLAMTCAQALYPNFAGDGVGEVEIGAHSSPPLGGLGVAVLVFDKAAQLLVVPYRMGLEHSRLLRWEHYHPSLRFISSKKSSGEGKRLRFQVKTLRLLFWSEVKPEDNINPSKGISSAFALSTKLRISRRSFLAAPHSTWWSQGIPGSVGLQHRGSGDGGILLTTSRMFGPPNRKKSMSPPSAV